MTSSLLVVVQFSFLYSCPAFILCHAQKTGQQQKKKKIEKIQPLLQSLGHGSNTITMVLPGPQGTVQYSIRTQWTHAAHKDNVEVPGLILLLLSERDALTEISVPHSTPLSSQLPPFYLSNPAHPRQSHCLSCFFHHAVCSLICGIKLEEGWLYPSELHPNSSGFPSVLSMSLCNPLEKQSSLRLLKNGEMPATDRVKKKKE